MKEVTYELHFVQESVKSVPRRPPPTKLLERENVFSFVPNYVGNNGIFTVEIKSIVLMIDMHR